MDETAETKEPTLDVEPEDLAPRLQSGFPWHHPTCAQIDTVSADDGWSSLHPILMAAFPQWGAISREPSRLRRGAPPLCPCEDAERIPDGFIAVGIPMVLIKCVADSGWDPVYYQDGTWESWKYFGRCTSFCANPLPDDADFCRMCLLHRRGFRNWVHLLEERYG